MTTWSDADAAASATHPRRWHALGLLGAAQLMLILDVTVVAVALPTMATDLGLGREALTWVVSAYTLTFGGLMLLGGRAADLYGAGRLVMIGLTLFTAGSLLAGAAAGGGTLIGGRIVQGLGAALMSPAALSVVVRLFDGEERNRALGVWSALGGVGAALGVLLGGVVTAGAGWAWIFWINVPIGVVVLAALARMLPSLPTSGTRDRLDVVGAAIVTGATAAVIVAFVGAGDRGWTSPVTLGLVALGVLLYAVLGLHLNTAGSPLVPPALLTRRPVVAGTVVLFVGTGLMVSVFFLGTFALQEVFGHGPLLTGLFFLPVALGTMLGAHSAGRLLGRLGARPLGVGGLGIAAAGFLTAALAGGSAGTVIALTIGSMGLGVLFVVASATALGQVEAENAGAASGLLSTAHELGASLGAAVMSGVAATSLLTGAADGFERGFLVAAGVAAVAAALVAALLPRREA